MSKKSYLKKAGLLAAAGIVIAASVGFYLFNMPHRDVQGASVDYQFDAQQLVAEYLDNAEQANAKYLDEEGDSKILIITGPVSSVTEDMNKQKVVLIKYPDAKAGVSCTFMESTNAGAANLKTGETVSIKGVIRSGAGYDADLEFYEDAILEKCDIVNNQ